jgi:5-keto-L-gluconate epimerase
MKYSIVISATTTKFGPVIFKGNLKENILKAKSYGYDGVEITTRDIKNLNIKETRELLTSQGLVPVSLGTGQIYVDEKLSFTSLDKKIRNQAVERLKTIIDAAAQLNTSIIIGLIRGSIENTEAFDNALVIAEERICECMEECIDYAGGKVFFLLEPINRYETNIFNRLEDVNNFLSKFKNRLDIKSIGILADTFHMNIEEPSIAESFKNNIGLIKHIHFADSNRWPPGYGHIDFHEIIVVLKKNRYEGFISFELFPLPDPDTAAKSSLEYIKKIEMEKDED